MRKIQLLLAMALIGVAAFAVSPTPASAHGSHTCDIHPGGGYGCTHYGGGYIDACDNQVDGHRVRAWYTTTFSFNTYVTQWAPSRGCFEPRGASNGLTITKFRICIEYEGCTAWKRVS